MHDDLHFKAVFILIGVILMLGILTHTTNIEYSQEELEAAKKYILSEIDNETLCEELYEEMDALLNDEESLDSFNEYRYTMYILQGFNADMQEGGLGLYLYNTECKYIEDLGECLKSLGLIEIERAYKSFLEENFINTEDFYNVDFGEEDERLVELYKIYSLQAFDDEFNKLNADNLLTNTLAKYARENIDEFNYGRLRNDHIKGTADHLRVINKE